MKIDEFGHLIVENALRFRTTEEMQLYLTGKIAVTDLPQPGTAEYDEAPYEQGFMVSPHFKQDASD